MRSVKKRGSAECSSNRTASSHVPPPSGLYALQDPNWNATAVCGSTGTIEERYINSGYGEPMFLDGNFGARSASLYGWETLFGGYRYDGDSALYFVRHRLLHAMLGSWILRDPLYASGTRNAARQHPISDLAAAATHVAPNRNLVPIGITALSAIRRTDRESYLGQLNLYQYCQSSPASRVDPAGLTCRVAVHCWDVYWHGIPT